jgi:DNA polymerase-1
MIGLDGRRIEVKSEHYALSSYLQGGEAVIMKQALVFTHDRARHLDWHQLMVVHDEIQSEVLREQARELGELQVQTMVDAGLEFNLLCPVTGEYRIGSNWAETH